MSVLAAVRPDEWNLPLFVHVLGAMLTTAVLVVAVYGFVAARAGLPGSARFGFRTLLVAGIPSFLTMRIGAQWIADKENLADSEAAWITIGYLTTDLGLLFLLIALICSGMASKRSARGESPQKLIAASASLSGLLVALYLVAIWAMTMKPE